MKRHAASLLVALLCIGSTATIARADAPAAENPKALATARAMFDAANDAYDKHDYEGAYEQFKASFSLHEDPSTAANLGACELKLGRHRDAARHLAYALRLAALDDPNRARYDDGLKEARADVGTLDVEAPAGADLLVDDVLVAKAPLADPVFVEPGKHKLRAVTTEGAKELAVTIGAGERQPVVLAIDRGPKPAASAPPTAVLTPVKPAPADSSADRSGQLAASFLVGGIGVAALAVGAVFGVKAIHDNNASNAGHCDEQTNRCDQAGADLRSSSRVAGNLSTGFVLGGLAVVGVGIGLFATAPAGTNQTKVSAGPGSLWVSGTW